MFNPYDVRSLLIMPASNDNFLARTLVLEGPDKPDAVIFDLEDAVSPMLKSVAREKLFEFLASNSAEIRSKYLVGVRINSASTEYWAEDLRLTHDLEMDFLAMTKVEDPGEIDRARDLSGCDQVFVAIETLKGYRSRKPIISEMNPLDFLTVGYEDFCAELYIDRPRCLCQPSPLSAILFEILLTSREHHVCVIDAITPYVGDGTLELVSEECHYTRSIGMFGKVAIHPSQVSIINDVYDRNKILSQIDDLLSSFSSRQEGSYAWVDSQGRMVGAPLYRKLLEMRRLLTGGIAHR